MKPIDVRLWERAKAIFEEDRDATCTWAELNERDKRAFFIRAVKYASEQK